MKMLTETRCQGGANLAIMSASHIGVHHDRFAGTARRRADLRQIRT